MRVESRATSLVLETGRRTATPTATTPVRMAEPGADVLDVEALARLAEGHRREDHRRDVGDSAVTR
jgi:hypothetical protein